MKKSILWCISIMVLLGVNLQAQNRSINFEQGTFEEAFNKAKKNGKLLFVDCYTSWCGPCKILAKEVFTDNEVADYFNEYFISFKVDCEKGEGSELSKRFGVSGYPTLLFINEKGEIINKIVGASRQPQFLESVKKGLDTENSLFVRGKKYDSGYRDREFIMNLLEDYKAIREIQKAKKISIELLESMPEKEWLTAEMWKIIRYYYVSTYGSKWWNFILEHSDEYISLVGKEEFADKIGETMHPYLFGYIYGRKKVQSKEEFVTYKAIINKYQPKQKDILYHFITLGQSANFDNHDQYVKTVLKVLPELSIQEHYRFFSNAIKFLAQDLNKKQKKQLILLLKKSFSMQRNQDYFKSGYDKFVKCIEEC